MTIIYLVLGMASFLFYRKGLMDGMRLRTGSDLKPIVTIPKKPTAEEAKHKIIMKNIENYTGDDKGQVKV